MFFTAIHQMMTNVDLRLSSAKRNGQLLLPHYPSSNGLKDEAQNQIVPLTVTETPQELDAGFLQTVTRPIQKASGLIANMVQFEHRRTGASRGKAAKVKKVQGVKGRERNGKNTRS